MPDFPPLPTVVSVPVPGLGVSVLETPVSQSFSATGGRSVQIKLASGYYLWLDPDQYELVPDPATTCAECAPDGEPVVADTTHCEQCGQRVTW